MLKKNLLNLFLLCLFGLLSFLVINTEPENNLLDPLTTLSPDTVSEITIKHKQYMSHLSRSADDNNWHFTKPININANKFRISSVLKLLTAPVHGHYPLTDIDLEKTGLSKPATTITLDHHRIAFGIINPLNNLRYVLYNKQVYLIEDVYSPLLSSHFTTLVSLELLPGDSKIYKLVLPHQEIFKDEKNLWKSTQALNSDKIIQTIQAWQNHQAFAVHQYLPRPSLGTIKVFLEPVEKSTDQHNSSFVEFQVTDTDPWLILARPDLKIEYHLDLDNYNTLIEPLADEDNNNQSIDFPADKHR